MKKYNLQNTIGLQNFKNDIDFAIKSGWIVEFGKVVQKRTNTQNASLHLWETQIVNLLNEYGITYTKTDLLGTFEFMHTKDSVHDMVLLIIKNLFGYKSSTEMKTTDFDQLIDVMTMYLSNFGISVKFPSWKDLITENKF